VEPCLLRSSLRFPDRCPHLRPAVVGPEHGTGESAQRRLSELLLVVSHLPSIPDGTGLRRPQLSLVPSSETSVFLGRPGLRFGVAGLTALSYPRSSSREAFSSETLIRTPLGDLRAILNSFVPLSGNVAFVLVPRTTDRLLRTSGLSGVLLRYGVSMVRPRDRRETGPCTGSVCLVSSRRRLVPGRRASLCPRISRWSAQ